MESRSSPKNQIVYRFIATYIQLYYTIIIIFFNIKKWRAYGSPLKIQSVYRTISTYIRLYYTTYYYIFQRIKNGEP